MLAALSACVLILFGGVTDRLIPLFAVGAFLAFTLSQAGMVAHWRRTGGRRARHSMLVNGFGALATATTVVVVIIAKFTEGAWVTMMLIPGLMILMVSVRRHYDRVAAEIADPSPLDLSNLRPPLVVLPISDWSKVTEKALRFALTLSSDIQALFVHSEQEPENLPKHWKHLVEEPARQAGLASPQLVVLESPYRYVIAPILDYVLDLERRNPDRQVAVLVPEMVESHWYHYPLHNQRAEWLKALLLLKGNQRIIVINVPWYVNA